MRVLTWAGVALVAASMGCGGGGDGSTDPDAGGDGGRDAGGPAEPCAEDGDCDDGSFCNGVERCAPGDGAADARGCAPATAAPCEGMACSETMSACLDVDCDGIADADGDGEPSVACGGSDCDDSDPRRFPGALEVCDDIDQDCDPATFGTVDADADGYISSRCCNPQVDGARLCGPDCDDSLAAVSPMAGELCNGMDDDCDGVVDGPDASATCTLFGAATTECTAGACVIVDCEEGRDDCDGMTSTGCEVELATNPTHCGTCGMTCPAAGGTPICRDSSCDVDGCAPGTHTCDGACVLDSAVATCGSRCDPCPVPDDGSATCTANVGGGFSCGIACDAGFAPVGGACVTIPAPRPLAPLTGSVVVSTRPTVHVELPAGLTGFEVELCEGQRNCGSPTTVSFSSGSGVLPGGAGSLGDGRAYFFRLRGRIAGVTGTAVSPWWHFWTRVSSVASRDSSFGVLADFDANGYADLAIGTDGGLYYAAGQATGEPFGAAAAVGTDERRARPHLVGDVDGDGYVDLLVDRQPMLSRTTECGLRRGSASGLGARAAIAGVTGCVRARPLGDVQRDGYADVAILDGSTVKILLGGPSGLTVFTDYPADVFRVGERTDQPFAGGDFDGDGYGDLARFRPGPLASGGAAALLYYGGPTGLSTTPEEVAINVIRSYRIVDGVAPAGDVNRDGYSDLLYRVDGVDDPFFWVGGLLGGADTLTDDGVLLRDTDAVAPAGRVTMVGVTDVVGDATGLDGFDDVAVDDGSGTLVWKGSSSGIDDTGPPSLGVVDGAVGLGPAGIDREPAVATWTESGGGGVVEVYVADRGNIGAFATQTVTVPRAVDSVAGSIP